MAVWKGEELRESDLQDVAELGRTIWGRKWRRSCDPSYYKWKYFGGYRPTSSGVILRENGRLIAMLGTCSRPFRFGHESAWALEFCDAMTHPEYRGKNIFSDLAHPLLEQMTQADFLPIYAIWTREATRLLERKFGMESLFDIWRLILPLTPEAAFTSSIPAWTARLGFGPVTKFREMGRNLWEKHEEKIDVRREGVIGSWVDELWSNAQTRLEAGVSKDKDYLRWRYCEGPDTFRIYRAVKSNETVGLLVTKVRARTEDRAIGFIADILVPSYDRAIIKKLLMEAELDFKSDKVIWVEAWSTLHRFYLPALASFGFWPVSRIPIRLPADQVTQIRQQGWSSRLHWTLNMGDSDYI